MEGKLAWIDNWKHQRILKGLGSLEVHEVEQSERFMERKHEADAMPCQFLPARPVGFIAAERWITNYRELPEVRHDFDKRIWSQRNVRSIC